MICSETIFKSIFNCVKDVAQTVRELEEKKVAAQERKKVAYGAYAKPEGQAKITSSR
jgi:hypothetical protein